MIAEIGHYALVLALAVAMMQSILPVWGARRGNAALIHAGSTAALVQCALVGGAFAALLHAHVTSDFSLANVAENSHTAKPLLYKITGVWGNHEGSMLLWVSILALFGALVAGFGHALPPSLRGTVVAVQGWIGVAFLTFVLVTSNPFARLDPALGEGSDLNPILQDIGLAIHPPLLYLGYVGLSITFAFAIAALIEGKIHAAWARWIRPWTLAAWIFLTLGIAMGSYWAYYELGWGGWWFWDPVENASLMPWLAATALLHSAVVTEKRAALKVWTVLLAILAFSLSLLGTFLVRSGVLTSVHAFATDPTRGIFILVILGIFIGGALALFAWRTPSMAGGGLFAPISREGALVLNNLLLMAALSAVFIGTLYPLILEALTGEKISVGPPFFNATFAPVMAALLIVMPFGPLLAWKRADALAVLQRLASVIALCALIVALAVYFGNGGPILAPFGLALSAFVILGAMVEWAGRIHLFREPLRGSLRRAAGLPRAASGMTLAHLGVGVCLLGIVASTAWQVEAIAAMKPGQSVGFGAYTATLSNVFPRQGPNYQDRVAAFDIRKSGVSIGRIEAAKRFYPARQMPTAESGIKTLWFDQIYMSLGEIEEGGRLTVRLYHKPLVTLIWIGCVIMALGGALSLSDRRLRVGVPATSKRV